MTVASADGVDASPITPFLKDDVPRFVVNEGGRFEPSPASARTKGVCSVRTERPLGSTARATGQPSRSTGPSCSMSSPIRSSRYQPSWSVETEATCRSCSRRPRPSERSPSADLGEADESGIIGQLELLDQLGRVHEMPLG